MPRTFDDINDVTGFANGDKFTSEEHVREYFTQDNLRNMFSGECRVSQSELEGMADAVIEHRWHCNF